MAIKEFFGCVFLCFLVFGLTGFSPLGQIRSNEPVGTTEELGLHINFNNNLDEDFDNVRIRVFLPELDIVLFGSGLDVGENEKLSSWMFWDVPSDIPPGDYLVRITASGNGFKDVDYTYVSIY